MQRTTTMLLCRRSTAASSVVRRLASMNGAAVMAVLPSCVAFAEPRRFNGTAPDTTKRSAVNVEEFTLDEEIVRRDMEAMARWNELSEAIDAARAAQDQKQLLEHVTRGLAMLEEMGADTAPIQCESLLCMEGSQAHYNAGSYEDALALARRARDSLTAETKPALRDDAQIAEIDQFIGFTLCKANRGKEAQEVLEKVLQWIDVDAKSAMPMQAVAAVNLRRSVLSGLGQSIALQARAHKAGDNAGEAKELYGKALDILIEALNKHIDENDFELVKSTLEGILECFEGLQDVEQAVTTCRKYISWCSRHEDEAGVEQGKKMLADICERHGVENPLTKEEAEGKKE